METLKRCYLIFVIIFISSFALFVYLPVRGQYLYKRVADSYNYTVKTTCRNQTDDSEEGNVVSSEVSHWNFYLNIVALIPSSVAALLIASWGDRVGRKIVLAFPILGFLAGCILCSLIMHYRWSLNLFFLADLMCGLGGGYVAMTGQGAAYISDITAPENRGKRFIILECSVGIGAGIAGVCSGYWLDASGFLQPIVCVGAIQFFSFLLIFLLPDSKKIRDKRNEENISPIYDKSLVTCEDDNCSLVQSKSKAETKDSYQSCEECKSEQYAPANTYTFVDLLRSVWRLYTCDYSYCTKCHAPAENEKKNSIARNVKCIHNGGGFSGRVWRMWFYVISEFIFISVVSGVSDLQTIYFLSEPLCFTPLLIGLQQGLKFTLYGFAPFLVFIYRKCCGFSNNIIAISGFVGLFAYSICFSLATSAAIVFAGTGAMLLVNTTRPFIYAQMSGMVLKTEQGAAIALVNFGEILGVFFASVFYLSVYPATIGIYRGFVFDCAAMFTLIAILLITIIHVSDRKRFKHAAPEEQRPLIT